MATIINKRIYSKLEKILGNLEELPEYMKLEAHGFMDLHVDKIYEEKEESLLRIALSHYFEQNGDMIPDPDMEMFIFPDIRMVEPIAYQDSFTYREVFPEAGGIDFKARKDLLIFLNQWLSNILDQGFKKAGGKAYAL